MKNKVILISIDGMRPDGFLKCGNPFVGSMMEQFSYTLTGRSMDPPVTLPCHMSMFYGVPPVRHGILTNTYTVPVRPVNGIGELLAASGKCGAASEEYHTLVTADHGGHGRSHGVNCPEDMTIPMFFWGKPFKGGKEMGDLSLLDLAPTIASILGLAPSREWEHASRSIVDRM